MSEFDAARHTHVSDKGMVHIGTREFCVSVDCTPPSLPIREGDIVRVAGPPEVVGEARATSSLDKDGTVVLTLQYVAPGLRDDGVSQ